MEIEGSGPVTGMNTLRQEVMGGQHVSIQSSHQRNNSWYWNRDECS
jgi:hypothetical protein